MKSDKRKSENRKNGRRMRRRQRMSGYYTLVVVMLVIASVCTVCLTVAFNIKHIIVSGESENYTYMKIVESSGVRVGDNLVRLNAEKCARQILEECTYVETAEIEKKYPFTLKINVTRSIPGFNVEYEDGVLLVSRSGKILEKNDYYINRLPVIQGFRPLNPEIGKPVVSESEHINDAFRQITERYSGNEVTDDILCVDMSSEQNIVSTYKNGIVFKMGNWTDINYKLDLAGTVMNDPTVKDKTGFLTMIGTNQCSFRTNSEPVTEVITEQLTTSATDDIQYDNQNTLDNYYTDEYSDYNYYEEEPQDYQETYDENYQDWYDYSDESGQEYYDDYYLNE